MYLCLFSEICVCFVLSQKFTSVYLCRCVFMPTYVFFVSHIVTFVPIFVNLCLFLFYHNLYVFIPAYGFLCLCVQRISYGPLLRMTHSCDWGSKHTKHTRFAVWFDLHIYICICRCIYIYIYNIYIFSIGWFIFLKKEIYLKFRKPRHLNFWNSCHLDNGKT